MNALKTVSMRIRGVKTELEEAGEDTEGMVTNTAKLQEKIMALTNIDGSGGVDILTRSGDFKSTYDILLEISKIWDKMDDVDQAALLELVAGKTRGSVVAALFQNGDVLEEAYKSATDASGSAMNELNNHLDSIQGRIDLFNNALQTMWMNFINTDVVKTIVDIGTAALKTVDALGVIPTLLVAFTAFKGIKGIVGLIRTLSEALSGHIAISSFATAQKQAETAAFLKNSIVLTLANSSLVQHGAALAGVEVAQLSTMTTTQLLSFGFMGLLASIKKATAALWTFLTATPLGWITLAIASIPILIGLVDALTTSHEEYIEELEETTDALKSVQNELQNVQSELEATQDRMDELNSKEKLSFVEEEELNRLKEQTKELERQEQILQAQEKRARNKQIETAIKAMETDPDLKGINWSSIFSGIVSNSVTGEIGLTNQSIDDTYIDKYQTNIEELKKAKEDLVKAEQDLASFPKAEGRAYKKAEDAVKQAQERVDKYNNAIDSLSESWTTKYGEIGYIEDASTDLEKQWNELYRQHQDYLSQQAFINGDIGKADILDKTFGATATDAAKKFKKEFEEAVNSGKDPSDVINDLFKNQDYSSAFSGLEKQFGITMDNIKDYFTQTGDFVVEDPEFDITKYSKDIKSHSAVISEFQEAIQKLGKGSFTMDDYLDLIERFPDLAKGVDISSNAFHGLSRNLNKAIKSRTKDFINDLKNLKQSLIAAGKSTESIDQLIEAVENMPDDALDDIIEKYGTLADKINSARTAQDKLLASMEEKPNQGYESRGEAMEYMKEAMSKGEIGSESNLWNVAKQYGFTYDSSKTINDNADALAKFIAIREKWFKQNDDGDDRTNDGYSYEGTESFIESVEKAVGANAELQNLLKWDYDEETGTFEFDYDNNNLDEIISLLSKTEEVAGLTADEWMDMMVQIGQFFDVKWDKASDVEHYISKIAEGSGEASDKVDQMTDSVKAYVDKALGTDLDFSSLTEASIMALDCDDDIKQLLKTYLTLKQTLEDPVDGSGIDSDPLKISEALLDGNISKLKEIEALQGAIKEDSKTGFTVLDTDAFRTVLEESGYAKDKIDELILKIQEYNSVVSTSSSEDPLGLKWIESANPLVKIDALKASLSTLGVSFDESIGAWFDGQKEIKINVPDLVSTLQSKNWNEESIRNYCNQLANTNIDGFKILVNQTQLDEALAKSNEIPEEENTTYTVDGSGLQTLKDIKKAADNIPTNIKTTHTTEEIIVQKTETEDSSDNDEPSGWLEKLFKPAQVNGTAHVQGTAYSGGSWGAPQTETSLVGELGPEILVRNGRWTTVGENGAEFTQVKRGDIIFNHKQTESLLKNGYVTGRGKAYAGGTAFAAGGSQFSSYTFSGEGGYIKYDVNGNELDRFGEAVSNAGESIEDAADEFKETFDWIEVRLEEIDENLGILNAQLENASNYSEKNSIIDKIIGTNENKMENLSAGIEKYAEYASTLLAKIPEEYKQAAQDGAIAITEFAGEADEATVEAISNYREWAQKVADLRQQLEEVKTEIKELAMQKFDNSRNSGDVRATVEDSQTEKLQNAVDLIEESGRIADEAYYEAMMENSNKKIEYLTKSRNAMQKELDAAVASGQIERGSDEWYELVNQMYEVDAAIDEATLELEQFQNAINDIEWENFDQLINRIGYLKDETQSLIDLMDSDDMFNKQDGKEYWGNEDVSWTDEGVATLGLYAQQMEIAEYEARQYGEAIDSLKADYEAGLYSENEYLEKLNELKSAQYDSIEAYEEAKDAIVELNKARIDHVKKGIEKEIDAYSELIEKKKEALDAERDLHDFQKSVMDQQKDIADLQRQLDALAYDNSASARAKKAQLQAEIAEANAELEETYYDRSISNQQEALDKELENFKETKEKEIEDLDLYLENVEQVVADSLMIVQTNAATVYDTLNAKADEYGLNVSDTVTKPWQEGSNAISGYQETFDTAASSTMDQLDGIKNKWQEVIDKMEEASDVNVEAINKENANYVQATEQIVTTQSGQSKTVNSAPSSSAPSIGSTVVVKKSATNFSANSNNAKMASFVPGGSYTVYETSGNQVLIGRNGQYTGWVKQTDLEGYAKGTKSISKDQLAIIDELGEELVLRAKNGRLAYMEKGSSVIPADLTSNLMEWGKLDPSIMLDRNRPEIGVHPEVHNTEIKLDITYGDMVSIGEFHGDNLADLEKMVAKQFEKHTKNLNNAIRKYVR